MERPYLLRLRCAVALGVLLWAVLVYRLVVLQIIQGELYAAKAKRQHERKVPLEARRGRLLDHIGERLAINLRASSFVADPSQVEAPQQVAAQFAAVTGQSRDRLLGLLTSDRAFVWLARKVEGAQADRIRAMGLPGVRELEETRRYYPLGTLAGQVLGRANVDQVGIEGCELAFEGRLKGLTGWTILQLDARGGAFQDPRGIGVAPQDGEDLVLTLDAVCQAVVEEELGYALETFKAKGAIGVVMVPSTGEILAMANVPLYDPNRPIRGDISVMRNRVITDPYEPGSTFKVVAASAALEEGTQRPDDRIFCENGAMAVPGGAVRDTHPHGWLTFREVIERSSNIGTIKVARGAGAQALYRYARAFGFGEATGIDLPGEAPGEVKGPSAWSSRSIYAVPIGYEVSVTPLQIAAAYGAIANGGLRMRPHLLKAVLDPEGAALVEEVAPQPLGRAISEGTAQTVTEFLVGVVERGTGTKAEIDGLPVAGKTGTAKKPLEGGRGYAVDRFVSSFVGFTPAYRPQLLCLVIVDEPRGGRYTGGEVAAPTFRRIVERLRALRRVPIDE